MKLSKTIWIILAVVVMGVAFGYLYMTYSRQQDEQAQLKSKLTTNQATLSRLVSERENVQAQLTKLQEQLEVRKQALAAAKVVADNVSRSWPRDAESIEYGEQMFSLTGGWNLDIDVVTAADSAAKNVQGISFTTTAFAVSVTGQPLTSGFAEAADYQNYVYQVVGNILGFVDAVARDKNFATAQIDSFSLAVPPLLTQEEVVAQGVDVAQPTATFAVTVYTYKGG
jgi:cell division protein FtsB